MKTQRFYFLYALPFILGFVVLARSTLAQEIPPFYSRNQSPFIHIFGLPTAESGTLVSDGQIEARAVFEVINNFTRDRRPQQLIILDGETYRYTLFLRWGISEKLEAGVDLPYLTHNQGVLDNFIEDWHAVFGFSNKKRQEGEKNQLNYAVWDKGKTLIQIHQQASGWGDVLFSLAVPLSLKTASFRSIALRTGVKLPTGNPHTLHGSGNMDFYLSLNASDKSIEIFWPLWLYGGLGLLFTGKGEVLQGWQRHPIVFGSAGIGGHFGQWIDLKIQTDAQTAFYDNPSQQLGVFSAQLVMGGTVNLPRQTFLDLGVSEDLIKDTAPDLILHFALRRQF